MSDSNGTGPETPVAIARPYVPAAGTDCRCGYCGPKPSPLGGDPRALLYSGPGATDWAFETRVREGAWDDIPALFDASAARVHLPAIKRARHIHLDVNAGRHHLRAVFAAHPDWLSDAEVAEGLHAAEVQMQYQLDRMRREAAEREQAKRHEAPRGAAA